MYSRFTYYLVVCFDFILIQPWIKVMYCSLIWLTLHIRAGISIWIVAHGRCCISCCFYFILFFYLYFSKSCKPDQFLILIKVSFFSNLPFLLSFKSLLLLLLLWFLLLLLLFSLPSSLLSEALFWLLLVVALLFSIYWFFYCLWWFFLFSLHILIYPHFSFSLCCNVMMSSLLLFAQFLNPFSYFSFFSFLLFCFVLHLIKQLLFSNETFVCLFVCLFVFLFGLFLEVSLITFLQTQNVL